ncbi:MAG: c-type cytochrome [Candidatus Thiodiazotropha sp. (ex Dulcina madagascariensis)]|nr:c-type cytochrome [Candidatus Thiodiazotropha sp. (ex Epidulcina cf. delphinae)]MCU7921926.1 c-type cytochrome [Candidatus Thiodiazotropha sp. (ex Dulcina madagascariensis)]MCU7924843.1 c-type cytochrome [Candidatus Thiodiazotropha sp. (ex Dulcina madagascariensis)]
MAIPAYGVCDEQAALGARWPEAVPLVVQPCFPCHGPQGRSGSPAIPSLAGLPRDYLEAVMRAYRYGGRFGTVMGRLLQAYDDKAIGVMARYFSRQPYPLQKQTTDWRLADRGRMLHRRYCRDCHGDLARPAEKGVPPLHGRWMDYLRWTLRDYLVGINQGDEEMAEQLRNLLRRQGPEGLEALVHYYGKAKP